MSTRIHQWRHKQELHYQVVYEHIRDVFDGLLDVMVSPLYHLLYSQILNNP